MESTCAICRTNCGIGTIVTNNGESICSICVEKCGGRKNSNIKVMSIPELKDIVREYNRNALEARSMNTNNSNIDLQVKSVLKKIEKNICLFRNWHGITIYYFLVIVDYVISAVYTVFLHIK